MTMQRHLAAKLAFGLILALSVSACQMSAPPSRGGNGAQSLISGMVSGYRVTRVNVVVPRNLVVSEENSYKPVADIVWHGEAAGDRYAQVQRLVQGAMQSAVAGAQGATPVIMDVQVIRFHALTPKTRSSIGGRHELEYMLTLRDAATGSVLRLVPRVVASVRGSGGALAAAEEAAGRSQAVVIREALAASVQKELSRGSQGGFAAVARAQGAPAVHPLN